MPDPIPPHPLRVAITIDQAKACLRLIGELDVVGMPAAAQALDEALAAERAELILDLAELEFLDSFGLRFVVTARTRCADAGCRLVLRGVPPAVRRVLDMAGLTGSLGLAE